MWRPRRGSGPDAKRVQQTPETGLARVADPLAYARRAITNEFLERKRRQVRWLRYVRLSRVEPHHIESPEGGLAERDALLRAFAVLSARERTAVVLRYYEGWEDAAIAEAVGCTRGTVRSLLSRAMAKLRRSMSEDGPAEQGGRS